MKPLLIPLIEIKHNDKSEKDFVKLKFCRYPTSKKSDLYVFKTALFDNGEPKEFLLFVHDFNMTLAASWTLATDAKVKYLPTLVCGEALRQFDLLPDDVEGMNRIIVKTTILGLDLYLPPAN